MKTGKEIFMYALAALVTLCFFTTLGMVIFNAIPEGNVDSINILLGMSGAGFMMVLGYFFGSTKGSAEKTEHMVEMTKKPM